jgi:hypothetical protein
MFDPLDSELAGKGNDQATVEGSSDGSPTNELICQTDMESQMESWKEQAEAISDSAGILAGADGSARKKKGVINGAYGWGVYGTGETTVGYWQNRKAADVQIMCSGGNVDWAMQSARSNTQAEQTHILAAMIQLFPVGLDVFVCS